MNKEIQEKIDDGELTEVKVIKSDNGHEGPGWYVWEVDCEEDGYVLFSKTRPTAEQLREVCDTYVDPTLT